VNLSTLQKLKEWARWGVGPSLGYPSISPMFGERALKSPLFGIGHIPDGVLEVEIAVCRLHWDGRQVIIYRWQWHRTYRQMAALLHCSTWSVARRLRAAEGEIDRQLDEIYGNHKQEMLVFAHAR
jgi:hypothetical protein